MRQCQVAAGDPAAPDMVTFLGWEWTQIGNTPQTHYGHKNVVLRDLEEVPARPISSREKLFPGDADPLGPMMRLFFIATAVGDKGRQPDHDFARFLQERAELPVCASGVPVRDLPTDCQESAPTPAKLFTKLDDWGFPYLVIPHGNTWGFYTPPLTSWDKQLMAHSDPDRHEPLIEVFSGHGNIEEYRPWRATAVDADGNTSCPPPSDNYLPECWRAGQIIEQRCLDEGLGEIECADRAATARANFVLTNDSGHWSIAATSVEDSLGAGQCRDCYMPAYNRRPAASVQYGLAIRDFSNPDEPPKRFRWGIIGSSDVHTARPGTGYKEYARTRMTDAHLARLGPPDSLKPTEPLAEAVHMAEVGALAGPYFERFSSFFGTGGLVAAHSSGRDRGAVWDALQRKEVYGTSGDRILLWFDHVDGDVHDPMGSSLARSQAPSFEVRALGAFEQKLGCPEDSINNAAQLRCQYDEQGVCVAVQPCYGDDRSGPQDDRLAPASERAWSSPIFVDYAPSMLQPNARIPGS